MKQEQRLCKKEKVPPFTEKNLRSKPRVVLITQPADLPQRPWFEGFPSERTAINVPAYRTGTDDTALL